jgi:hypothetical protein
MTKPCLTCFYNPTDPTKISTSLHFHQPRSMIVTVLEAELEKHPQ